VKTLPTKLVAFIPGTAKYPTRFYGTWRDAARVAKVYEEQQLKSSPTQRVRYKIRYATPAELTVERLLLVLEDSFGVKIAKSIMTRKLLVTLRPMIRRCNTYKRRADILAGQVSTLAAQPTRSRNRRMAMRPK
jgi:hypothetical protein